MCSNSLHLIIACDESAACDSLNAAIGGSGDSPPFQNILYFKFQTPPRHTTLSYIEVIAMPHPFLMLLPLFVRSIVYFFPFVPPFVSLFVLLFVPLSS